MGVLWDNAQPRHREHTFLIGHDYPSHMTWSANAGFARGATDSMEVHLPAPVGDLKRVVVRQTACPVDSEGVPDPPSACQSMLCSRLMLQISACIF